MAFDEDWNGVLDCDETDKFLDTCYISGSIFQGDVRLPPKEELKEQIHEKYALANKRDSQRKLSFQEVRGLISGMATVTTPSSGSSGGDGAAGEDFIKI